MQLLVYHVPQGLPAALWKFLKSLVHSTGPPMNNDHMSEIEWAASNYSLTYDHITDNHLMVKRLIDQQHQTVYLM